jgi:hypothetical protein
MTSGFVAVMRRKIIDLDYDIAKAENDLLELNDGLRTFKIMMDKGLTEMMKNGGAKSDWDREKMMHTYEFSIQRTKNDISMKETQIAQWKLLQADLKFQMKMDEEYGTKK